MEAPRLPAVVPPSSGLLRPPFGISTESGSPAAARSDSHAAVAEPNDTGAPAPPSAPTPLAPVRPASRPARRQPDPFDERLTAFRERAESVMIRLQKLEAGTPPGDGPSEVVRLR
jgi:hypothetical protein